MQGPFFFHLVWVKGKLEKNGHAKFLEDVILFHNVSLSFRLKRHSFGFKCCHVGVKLQVFSHAQTVSREKLPSSAPYLSLPLQFEYYQGRRCVNGGWCAWKVAVTWSLESGMHLSFPCLLEQNFYKISIKNTLWITAKIQRCIILYFCGGPLMIIYIYDCRQRLLIYFWQPRPEYSYRNFINYHTAWPLTQTYF